MFPTYSQSILAEETLTLKRDAAETLCLTTGLTAFL